MNRDYRIVWSRTTARWQAHAETTKRQGKQSLGKTRARTSSGNQSGFVPKVLIAALLIAWGVTTALAGPQGGQLVSVSATINQSTAKAAIDWNSFSVGKAESVRFNQPTCSSIMLNRVASLESSQIL